MITVSAFKWVVPFAQGNVRDHRVRWVLNELGQPYEARLIDTEDQASASYRALQPFGQVPATTEPGRPPMFESGAIVLDLALRAGRLVGEGDVERGQVLAWFFAALNSIEPFLMNVAEMAYFTEDETVKARRMPAVTAFAKQRLGEAEAAVAGRTWLVGEDFTVADLMLASVLKVARSLEMLGECPTLAAHQERCFARPAYRDAIAEQCAGFEGHGPRDMRYPEEVIAKIESMPG